MSRNFICRTDYPIAHTADGKLKGFELDGIITFHGVPYAKARRFHPAQPFEPWNGVLEATNYGPVAPIFEAPAPLNDLLTPHRYWPQDEQCQYLNIWTKTLEQDAGVPVLVWLHGGGFADGSSIEQVAYEGDELCRKENVVVVSINHRLNILGYLDLSSFHSEYANSANAGITDLVEALRWIRRNIRAFGGNPGNITLFGQSGGGGKVYTLLQTPDAAGLFHKAVIMSGSDDFDRSLDHAPFVKEMLRVLDIPESNVSRLESIPRTLLMKAYQQASSRLGAALNWGPLPNGYYLGHPVNVGFSPFAKTVPLIVGTVIAEFGGNRDAAVGCSATEEEKLWAIHQTFSGHEQELVQLFQKSYPNTDLSAIPKLDTWVRPGALAFMERRIKDQATAPGYLYQFALMFDFDDGTPAWHCADIPFMFHNTAKVPCANIPNVSERLENQMAGALGAFARTGNPNHPGLPTWLPYTSEGKETMVFDRQTKLRTNLDGQLLETMLRYLPPRKPFAMPVQNSGDTQWLFK